ncbi:MAG: hypothetical protein DRP16_05000, partial [Candidatus Aenigmatarchaeota archaeon]
YVSSDNGQVVLSISDTKAESIDIDVTGDSKSDDDSEGNLVVSPASLGDFVVSHDGQGVVNSAEPVDITARDIYQNTKTDYTGQITVSTTGETGEITWALVTGSGTFTDGGAGTDTATYTFSSSDNGVVTLSITDDSADTVNIAVSGDGKSDEDAEGNLTFTSSYIVIDNLDSGFSVNNEGDWSTSTTGNEYSTNWRRDNSPGTGSWARWTPNISIAGNYEVFAYWSTAGSALASNAPYTVYYAGGSSTVTVNQEINGNQWNSLGIFEFNSGTSGYVQLDDNANDDLCADAIKFVLKGSASAQANAVTTSSVAAGESDVLILDVTVSNNSTDPDTITSITVNNSGAVSDSEISSVKLYYDSNNSGDFNPGVDSQVGTGQFSSGTKSFSGLSIPLPGSGTQRIFVALDISQTVDDADSLDAEIPANGIILSNAPDIEDTALNSSGTRPISLVLDHFIITHDGAATAGVGENITVVAKDNYGNTKTSYTGTISLDTNGTATTISWALVSGSGSFTDGGPSSDTATYTFSSSDNGSATFSITDNKAETLNISVSGDGKTDDDSEGNLVVSPASLDHFTISHDGSASAGVSDNVTVTAKDAYGNTVSNYTGTITLDTNGDANSISWSLVTGFGTFSDGGAGTDTATYTFSTSDNSTATFSITDTKAETLNISVSGDGKTDDDSEGNLVVSPGSLDHFTISHDGSAQAGLAENVVIYAKDSYGNTVDSFTGQIIVDTTGTATTISWVKVSGSGTFSDGGIDSDTCTYTYDSSDQGEVTLGFTDTSVETVNISVAGAGKSDDDSEGNLVVGPGLIDHFSLTHDGFATQNQAENITIKAYDAYSNLKTDYTGTITVDTNGAPESISWALVSGSGSFTDGGAGTDTATYTFDSADNGEVILSITDNTAEIINISVSGDGKTDDDNEGILEVVAAGFHHFKISHDGNAVVGVAETITITARDANDELVTNYVGTMTVDTNGTASTISWSLSSGSGTFTDGGPSSDTATYTFVSADNGEVVLSLTDETQETIDISATGGGKNDDNTEGSLIINPTGIHHFLISHDGQATAGSPESVTVTAKDANNSTVTNYT